MKKSLLISASLLTLSVVTGIYAQTTGTTGSIIDKMKAVAHSFTLSALLNPTDTSLTSDPVKGKKTGDILTAGEWNRVLELIAQGGVGGAGWENVPLEGTENFDEQCMYRFKTQTSGRQPYVGGDPYYYPNGVTATSLTWWLENDAPNSTYHIYANSKTVFRINGAVYPNAGNITKIEKLCGGGVSAGTSNITWANFDGSGGVAMKGSNGITSIVRESAGNYRVTFSSPRPNTDYGVICTSGPSPSYLCFPNDKSTTSFLIKTSNPSNNVDAPFVSLIVTPFDVGASSSEGGIRPSSIDSSDRGPATFMSAFNQCKSEGKYLPTAEEALYFVFGGAGTIQNPTSNPLWTITPDDNRNTFVTVYSSGSGMDRTGADSTPYSTTATAYYRCVTAGGGSSSSSGWVDVPPSDTADFDINCEYRYKVSYPTGSTNAIWAGSNGPGYNYPGGITPKFLWQIVNGDSAFGVPSNNKNIYIARNNGGGVTNISDVNVLSMQKRCD